MVAKLSEPESKCTTPDLDAVLKFLEWLRPGGPWLLVAIPPDGSPIAATARTSEQVQAFLGQHNGTRNLYYSVNPTRAVMNKKAAKTDIAAIEFLLGDLDPSDDESPEAAKQRYLEQLHTFQPQPSALIDSGNGIQVLWTLAERIALGEPITVKNKEGEDECKFSDADQKIIDDVEARVKQVMLRLGAKAGTQNIDRILRIPGTINLPNAVKRGKGRVACETKLLWRNGASYELSAFAAPENTKQKANKKPKAKDKEPKPLSNYLTTLLHVKGSGSYPTRSELFWAFLNAALRHGIDEEIIIAACLDPAYTGSGIFEHVKDQNKDGRDYLKDQIEHALNDAGPSLSEDQKTIIRVLKGSRHEVVAMTQKALLRAGCPVFFRGGSLVQPVWRFEKTEEKNRDVLVSKFIRFNIPRLSNLAAKQAVRFQKYDAKSKSWVPIDPPNEVIETLLELGYWDFPSVSGIVNSPTMRPDGTLITTPGYDRDTQLWYKPAADIELPPIAEQPSRADAEQALKTLTELLSGFPFVDAIAKAVAINAVQTTTLRGAFTYAPLFLFLAPESGTGKTYLVRVIATIATGRDALAVVGCNDPKEMEKRLSAAAFEAMPILSLNNLSFDLESDLLCQMTSESMVGIRRLGVSELIPCDCTKTTVFANGNNVRVVGDLVRRTLTCNLDAKMEIPEARSFEFDPVARVKTDRGRYLAAAFTIARAYLAAGCPKVDCEKFAGFEDWSKMVRYPLRWLGLPDPVSSKKEARLLDPQREALSTLINAIKQHVGIDKEFTAIGLASLAQQPSSDLIGRAYPDLFEALSQDGRTISSKAVGKRLARECGRIRNGYRIACRFDPHGNQYVLLSDHLSGGSNP